MNRSGAFFLSGKWIMSCPTPRLTNLRFSGFASSGRFKSISSLDTFRRGWTIELNRISFLRTSNDESRLHRTELGFSVREASSRICQQSCCEDAQLVNRCSINRRGGCNMQGGLAPHNLYNSTQKTICLSSDVKQLTTWPYVVQIWSSNTTESSRTKFS